MNLKAIEQRASILAKNNGNILDCIDKKFTTSKCRCHFIRGNYFRVIKTKCKKIFRNFWPWLYRLAEILRIYEKFGVTKTFNFRNEIEMTHAATALSWQYKEIPAVVTSIGPGALQAMAGSLASSSNGVGVYHIYGDETTHGEGYNMQQILKREQDLYGKITALMSESHVFHTPESIRDGLRKGYLKTKHPYKAGPFYLCYQ